MDNVLWSLRTAAVTLNMVVGIKIKKKEKRKPPRQLVRLENLLLPRLINQFRMLSTKSRICKTRSYFNSIDCMHRSSTKSFDFLPNWCKLKIQSVWNAHKSFDIFKYSQIFFKIEGTYPTYMLCPQNFLLFAVPWLMLLSRQTQT